MTDTITIKTDVKAGIIVQDVVRASEPDVHDKIIRLVLDTQEEQARKALIGLGWRPPETEDRFDEFWLSNRFEEWMVDVTREQALRIWKEARR